MKLPTPARHWLNRARPSTYAMLALMLCMGAIGLSGCDGEDGPRLAETPSADWNPGEFLYSRLAVGARAEREVTISNVGRGDLLVANLAGEFNAPLDYSLYYYVRAISDIDGENQQAVAIQAGQVVLNRNIAIPPQSALVLVLEYQPSNDDGASGSIRFETNDPADPVVTLPIRGDDGGAEINVSPSTIDFGRIGAGGVEMRAVTITNIGSAPLDIDDIDVNGSQDFTVMIGEVDPQQDGVPADPDGDGIPGLESGMSFELTVIYAPEVDGPDSGEITIRSNDSNRPEVRVTLTANGASPCIRVNPETLEFAAALQGRTTNRPVRIESCGGQTLEIINAYLADGSSPVYVIADDSVTLPVELPALEQDQEAPSQNILIGFTPEDTAAYGGTLIVESNDPLRPMIEVPITGRGTLNDCPVAVVTEDEFNVLPLDIIELDGSASTDADGPGGVPVRYVWTVTQQPDGSTVTPVERFQDPRRPLDTGIPDDPTTPRALFFVDLAGDYTIELNVADNLDLVAPGESCPQPAAVIHIEAHPDQDIHVQMVWNTPGDADQTDSDGSDVDLHLRHPNGRNWAQAPLDCYYANAAPDWGPAGPPGNPSLDIDDVNGSGPENINLDEPEDTDALGGQYRVGIDYYRADNFATGRSWGPSEVTVRIFLGGVQAGEWVRVMQGTHHFWTVGSIIWTAADRRVQEINRYYQQVP